MKKLAIFLTICAAGLLTSCKDFLNQPAYDYFTDDEYWQNEDQARTYMYGFYPSIFTGYGSGYSHGQFLLGEASNDDYVSSKDQQDLQPTIVPETDGSWSFTTIRRANYALASAARINEDAATIAHWQGVARFFRACLYSAKVFRYGDVPWFDRVPVVSTNKAEMDYLYKDRDPRLFVDSMIIADFEFALQNVRKSDGAQQVNRYVVAAMASRYMLREGTYLKYHNIDMRMAEKCIRMAKECALMVMNEGGYSLAPSFPSLFVSEDLGSNPEIIMSRHYEDGVLSHSTLTYSFTEGQNGLSKAFALSFLGKDGLPVFYSDPFWTPSSEADFFANRDPRMTFTMRPKFLLKGTETVPYGYCLSGLSWRKFMDDENVATVKATWSGSKNVTDAPCLRYAEVLLNYAEAAYELSTLNAADKFTQSDLDKSINVLRDRADVQLPHLLVSGDQPMVGSTVYDDPVRLEIESMADGPETPSLLWEIRRERRVELSMEGFRHADLVRWKKLDYLWNECNPDLRYGCYIFLDHYTPEQIAQGEIVLDDPLATEGYLLRNTLNQRNRPIERNYISPVPSGQITLYKAKGYTLTQTKEWQ